MEDLPCECCYGTGIAKEKWLWSEKEPIMPNKNEKQLIKNILWAICNCTESLPIELDKYRAELKKLEGHSIGER